MSTTLRIFTLTVSLASTMTALSGCGASCGPGNCAGCCDASGACQAPSTQSCGMNGAACAMCLSFQTCFEGACMSPGGGNNGNSSNGNSSTTSNGTTTGQGTATATIGTTGSDTTTNGNGTTNGFTTSSSTTTSSTSSTSSTGSSGSNAPPTIASLSANPTTIGPGGSTVISAIVSDPDGLSNLAGGTLVDPATGGTFGAFSTPGGQGTFTYSLTWDALQSVTPFQIPAGGTTRQVQAVFYDNHGHSTSQTLNLTAACSPSGDAECNGYCTDLQTDPNNCGACGVAVSSGGSCNNGSPGCSPSYDVVCDGSCVDLKFDMENCGTCGNSCTDWANNHGLSTALNAGEVSCDYGTCAVTAIGYASESCSTLCAAQGTGLTCYVDAKCENADLTYTGYTNAGCANYQVPGSGCDQQTALSCSEIPSATQTACNTGTPGPASFSQLVCLCTG